MIWDRSPSLLEFVACCHGCTEVTVDQKLVIA